MTITAKNRGRPKNSAVRSREWLTPDEVERLADAANKRGRYGARDAFLIRFAARHGFRVSELCNLEWSMIDLGAGRVTIERLKKGFTSTHPLKGWEIRGLRKMQRDWPGRFVLSNERGGPFHRAGLSRIVERAGRAAGFSFPVHFHMLRHASGYNFVNQGVDTRSLQDWLGHKNIQHTINYTKLSETRFKGW
jgi:type 1 fimbriae regulatory protein FimE